MQYVIRCLGNNDQTEYLLTWIPTEVLNKMFVAIKIGCNGKMKRKPDTIITWKSIAKN